MASAQIVWLEEINNTKNGQEPRGYKSIDMDVRLSLGSICHRVDQDELASRKAT
jgi:uncharacterized protein (UPF0548 family)